MGRRDEEFWIGLGRRNGGGEREEGLWGREGGGLGDLLFRGKGGGGGLGKGVVWL